jgi:hypothetical protein
MFQRVKQSPGEQEIASAGLHRLAMTYSCHPSHFVRAVADAALLQSFDSEGKRNG